MITEIGIVAGEIWHYLDEKKASYFDDLVNAIGRERDLALMSLGWLGREGHVILEQDKKGLKVTLRF